MRADLEQVTGRVVAEDQLVGSASHDEGALAGSGDRESERCAGPQDFADHRPAHRVPRGERGFRWQPITDSDDARGNGVLKIVQDETDCGLTWIHRQTGCTA